MPSIRSFRRVVSHHPRQRRIGVEQRAGRRRHVNSVDGAFEQLAVAFLGQPLLGQRVNRRLARRIGVDKRAAEHLGGACDVTDLVVHVGRGNRGIFLAAGQRADRAGDRAERTHGAADHEQRGEKSDQHAGGPEHDALPFSVGQAFWRNRGPARVPCRPLRSRNNSVTRLISLALGAQHFLVELGDLAFGSRDRNDRIGIGIGRRTKRRIVDRKRPHASAPTARRRPGRAPARLRRSCSAPGTGFSRWPGRALRRWPARTGSRIGGNAAIRSARRAISAVTRSIPLR